MKQLLCCIGFCLLTMGLVSSAMAQSNVPENSDESPNESTEWDSGLELGASAGYLLIAHNIFQGSGGISTSSPDVLRGPGLTLRLGYHWKYFGIYAEQSFYYMHMAYSFEQYGQDPIYEYKLKENALMLQTMLAFRFYIPIEPHVKMSLGMGFGALYSVYDLDVDEVSIKGPISPTEIDKQHFNQENDWVYSGYFSLGLYYQNGPWLIGVDIDFVFLFLTGLIEPRLTFGYTF